MNALSGMAYCRLKMGQIKKARAMFQSILRRDPNHPGAIEGLSLVNIKVYEPLNLAWSKYYKKEYEGARVDFSLIKDDDDRLLPETELWRIEFGIAYTYYGESNFKQAKRNFNKTIKMEPTAIAYKGLGMAEFKDHNYLLALEAFTKSIELNQDQYDVFSLAAICLLKRGRESSAMQLFHMVIEQAPQQLSNDNFFQAIKGNPTFKSIYSQLGWALFHKRFFTDSLMTFETGINEGGLDLDPDLPRGAGYAAYSLKDYERAANHCLRSLESAPDLSPIIETAYTSDQVPFKFYSDAQTTLAWSYYYLNSFKSAKLHFNTAIKKHPDWPDPLSGLGWVYFAQKEYPDALKMFQKAIEIDPKYQDAHSGIAAVENL